MGASPRTCARCRTVCVFWPEDVQHANCTSRPVCFKEAHKFIAGSAGPVSFTLLSKCKIFILAYPAVISTFDKKQCSLSPSQRHFVNDSKLSVDLFREILEILFQQENHRFVVRTKVFLQFGKRLKDFKRFSVIEIQLPIRFRIFASRARRGQRVVKCG